MARIMIEPQGWCVEAGDATTMLMAAQNVGIRLARSCRNGTCRACLCHLRSGTVRYIIEWPGLSVDEKAEGFILPCVACATSDVVIEAPGATRLNPES
jgi:ferredoxin